MVHVLPARKTGVDEFLEGVKRGSARGHEFSQMAMQHAMKEKANLADIERKKTFAKQIMDDPELKDLNPAIRKMLAFEAAGITSAQGTKSTINALREQIGDERFNDIISNIDSGAEPSNGQNVETQPSMDGLELTDTVSEPPSKPKRNYDAEISKWQKALGTATSAQNKEFAKSRIQELQHQRDIGNKQDLAQTKEVRSSFTENQPFIDKVHDQYEDSLRRDAILDRMDQLGESGELSQSGAINFLESLGLKQEWLKNPANEEYTKLSLDLLGGGTLQADYGSRVLQSEFQVAQQRVPTLSQTPEGRRQISENIRTMLLPAKLKNDRMQFYIDQASRTGKSLPHDLRGRVLKDIKPQLEEAYDKFKQRNGRYKVKQGTSPDDNMLEKYFYLSNGNENKAIAMMKEDGYDVGE